MAERSGRADGSRPGARRRLNSHNRFEKFGSVRNWLPSNSIRLLPWPTWVIFILLAFHVGSCCPGGVELWGGYMKKVLETNHFRPTVARIDLAALRHNFAIARRLGGPRLGLLGVVKANAYGHGAVPVAK